VLEHREPVAVESIETLLGAEPEEADLILEHDLDGDLGEPLLDR
jgi:hypothetical protein